MHATQSPVMLWHGVAFLGSVLRNYLWSSSLCKQACTYFEVVFFNEHFVIPSLLYIFLPWFSTGKSTKMHLSQVDIMMEGLYIILGTLALLKGTLAETSTWGGLYPRESGSREVKSLDGLWNFRLAPLHDPLKGFREEWFAKPLCKVS